MHKIFIAGLSLGLLLLPNSLKASITTFSNYSVTSKNSAVSTPLTLKSPSSNSSLTPSNTYSILSEMSPKERSSFAKRLGSSKRIELETTIPTERQEAEIEKNSCCFIFWRGCFRVSSKTLGSLAIDIFLDLSDGKLDGKGPNGSIDYIHHIAEIINATIEEIRAEDK